MKKNKFPIGEFLGLIIGEVAVSAIVVLVYILLEKFSYKVITGVVLGAVLALMNFVIMSVTVSRAFDKAREARGTREMTEEEIDAFTTEQKSALALAVKGSYIVRMIIIVGALLVAFISKQFDVIATVVPFLAFKPILTLDSIIKTKKRKE